MADGVTIPATGSGTATPVVATDDAGAAGHVQVVKLAIATNGSATLIPADDTNGILVQLSATDNGVLDNIDADTSAIQTAVQIMDDWDESDRAKVNPIAGQAGVQGGSGTVSALTQRVVLATDVALPAGTNAVGKLLAPDIDVTTHTNYAKKYYTNAGAVTDGIIWSPAGGKRWHVVSMYINVSAAATVTLEDDKAAGDEAVFKSEFAANSGTTVNFSEKYPLASGEDAADLLITTTAGNVYVTVTGYEI